MKERSRTEKPSLVYLRKTLFERLYPISCDFGGLVTTPETRRGLAKGDFCAFTVFTSIVHILNYTVFLMLHATGSAYFLKI